MVVDARASRPCADGWVEIAVWVPSRKCEASGKPGYSQKHATAPVSSAFAVNLADAAEKIDPRWAKLASMLETDDK